MKIFLLSIIMTLSLVGCGNDNYHTKFVPVDKEVFVDKEVIVAQDFENSYYFKNGGYLEMVASSDNQISILRAGYTLTSFNPKNSTFGMHPVVTKENLEPKKGKIRFSQNVNYGSSSQYDLEEDTNGSNITGSKRTDYEFELLDDKNVKLTIKIYDNTINNNVNFVIATRVLTSY